MLDMRKFIYVKADPRNMVGYDMYVVKKCSCEKHPIVVGLPNGKFFLDYMPNGSYNIINRISPAEVGAYSQMFFVPREEAMKRNFLK
jgi:hypothetical protein